MKYFLLFEIALFALFSTGYSTPENTTKGKEETVDVDISKIGGQTIDFPKIDDMLNNYHLEQAVSTFNLQLSGMSEDEKIENISIFLTKIKSCIERLPNPEPFDFSKTPEKIEDLKEETKDKIFSWWDLILAPTAIAADCLGGCGVVTASYLTLRASYEYYQHTDLKIKTEKVDKDLSYKDLENFNLSIYENYKRGILLLNKLIDNLYSTSSRSNDDKIRKLKDNLNICKKELSSIRCSFVSNVIMAPKLEISYMYANLYNNQWFFKREVKLIDNAFLALSNSGPLIQASNKEIRKYWLNVVLPELKKHLTEKEFEDKVAMLSLIGDGKTGARYWLEWE